MVSVLRLLTILGIIKSKGGKISKMNGGKLNMLNRFFTAHIFENLLAGNEETTYEAIVQKYCDDTSELTNYDSIKQIYETLKAQYRNEYYYKNTLLNKLLLGVHSLRTTTALRELPVGRAKADFVLINGKAVVYEIKTELDNFERLDGQLSNYYKAFDHVVVVTAERNKENILKHIPDTVGVYLLTNRGTFKRLREPKEEREYLDPTVLFKMLRKEEYEGILKNFNYPLPQVGQFDYYKACKQLFIEIPVERSYAAVLKRLKARSSVNESCFKSVPYELKFLVYFANYQVSDYSRLDHFLRGAYRRG